MTVTDLGRMPAAEFVEWQAFIRLQNDIREKGQLAAEAKAGVRGRTARMRRR